MSLRPEIAKNEASLEGSDAEALQHYFPERDFVLLTDIDRRSAEP
jgi:hypothetical protein